MNDHKLLTVEDVSEVLKLPRGSVRRLIRKRLLTAVELPGGRFRVEAAALSAFIEGCKNGGDPAV